MIIPVVSIFVRRDFSSYRPSLLSNDRNAIIARGVRERVIIVKPYFR